MPLKLEDAQCAICMENLFDLRDDLDEVLPVATPDCGHVSHEKCLLQWFKFQADAYVAQMGDQGVDATLADAPAECPECRAECFADPETGEPAIHRLFINFTAEGKTLSQAPPSSQHVPSSPSMRWRSADKDVLGMARRARGLAVELDAAGAESHEDDVRGALRRAEALRADAVSSKAAEGFKTYVGRLNVALHKLLKHLEEHPLIGTLEGRVATLERQLAAAERDHTRATSDLERRMQLELDRLLVREREKAARDVARATTERNTMQREVEKSRIALLRARAAAEEREMDMQAKLAEAQRLGAMEKELRQGLQKDLADRTKTLKMWQAKAEKRGQLKSKLEELRAENEALRAAAASPQKAPSREDPEPSPEPEPEPIDDTLELEVEEPTLDSLLDSMSQDRAKPKRSTTMRTFSFGSPSPPPFNLASPSPPRSTTARTMSFSIGEGRRKPSPSKPRTGLELARRAAARCEAARSSTSNLATSSKYFERPAKVRHDSGSMRGGGMSREERGASLAERTSRLFGDTPERNAPEASHEAGREKTWTEMSYPEQLAELSDNPPPRPRHPPTTNGEKGWGDMSYQEQLAELSDPVPPNPRSHVLVDSSSPLRASKRSLDVIEVGSSPEIPARSRIPLEPKRFEKRTGPKREPSILDFLGVDSRGRQKGVMTGAKIRRRA